MGASGGYSSGSVRGTMSRASRTREAGVKIIWFVAAALIALGLYGLFNAGVRANAAKEIARLERKVERALGSGPEPASFEGLTLSDGPIPSVPVSILLIAAGSLLVLGSFAARRYRESHPELDDDPPPRC